MRRSSQSLSPVRALLQLLKKAKDSYIPSCSLAGRRWRLPHRHTSIDIYIHTYAGLYLRFMTSPLLRMKGGPGESTVTIHLAVAAYQAGHH
jgi:hypothetical protein